MIHVMMDTSYKILIKLFFKLIHILKQVMPKTVCNVNKIINKIKF